MGGTYERDESGAEESVRALRDAYEVGFRLFDTAELYGGGLTEEIIGRAMGDLPREDLFLISKVWKTHMQYDAVLDALRGSLKRLKTDHLDSYMVHWPSETVPMEETMSAMERAVTDGLARHIGVSNFSVAQLKEAARHLKRARLEILQTEYNLLQRAAETDLIPYCRSHDIMVISYRPLARGLIASEAPPALLEVAKKHQKTPAQVALQWLIAQGTIPIPMAVDLTYIHENYGALGWELGAEDKASLERISVDKKGKVI